MPIYTFKSRPAYLQLCNTWSLSYLKTPSTDVLAATKIIFHLLFIDVFSDYLKIQLYQPGQILFKLHCLFGVYKYLII